MTFKEFQQTREYRNDLISEDESLDEDERVCEAYIYGDFIVDSKYVEHTLHIIKMSAGKINPSYYLTLDRSEYMNDDLEVLEKYLYDFAKSSGYFPKK